MAHVAYSDQEVVQRAPRLAGKHVDRGDVGLCPTECGGDRTERAGTVGHADTDPYEHGGLLSSGSPIVTAVDYHGVSGAFQPWDGGAIFNHRTTSWPTALSRVAIVTEPQMPEMPQTPLEPIDEDWTRALAVVAHPDDLEYGIAGAIARWTDQGKQVVYCLVTSGEAGIDTMRPEDSRVVRETEQRRAAAIVGVDTVEFLGLPDGILEYGVPLRRAITKVVRQYQPDIVITSNFELMYGGVFLNQADHIAVGRATLDAVRDAGNRWVFSEQIEDGLKPWGGVKTVLAGGSPESKHGVDVSATYDRGLESLRAHETYLAALRPDQDPTQFLDFIGRAIGARLGGTYGVSFEAYQIS
jgi:LmbE family N-acetylglucosaminyl deacetylase